MPVYACILIALFQNMLYTMVFLFLLVKQKPTFLLLWEKDYTTQSSLTKELVSHSSRMVFYRFLRFQHRLQRRFLYLSETIHIFPCLWYLFDFLHIDQRRNSVFRISRLHHILIVCFRLCAYFVFCRGRNGFDF